MGKTGEQSTATVGKIGTDGVVTDGTVSVVRSLLATGQDQQLALVTVTTTGADPTAVRITERIPDTHTLTFPRDGPTEDATRLTVEGTVHPDSALRFGYLLTGPVTTDIPDPGIELRPEPPSADAVRATMYGADDAATELTVRTEELVGQVQLRIPLLTRTAGPGTAATPLDPSRRAMDDAAIGVVLRPTNEDAALRTVLRASQRGHTVLVTYTGRTDGMESLPKLSSLGAEVIDPPGQGLSQGQLNRHLSVAARERGLPGIVLQTRDCPRIDYERTADAYDRADYEVVAIPETWSAPSETPRIVVGIPAYNAETSIAEVVERAADFADDVVVVDDGSRDETAVRAREAGASVVIHEINRGYGGALKTLFRTADDRGAEHLVVIDADGQHDPADIPMLVETQDRNDTDIVIGSRYVGQRDTKIPLVRSVGLGLINGLTNVSMGKLRPSGFVHDTQSGYRAYSRRAIHSLAADPMIGNNMGASTDILFHAHRARLSVGEVPTTIYYDVENSSSQGSLSHGFDLLRNIVWTVEYGRPLLVVGGPGVISTFMGIAVTVLLLTTFIQTGTLAAHELLVSALFAVGGMLLCIAAILMHVLNVHPVMRRLTTDGHD